MMTFFNLQSSFVGSDNDDSGDAATATAAAATVAMANSVLSPNSTAASFHTATSPGGFGEKLAAEEQLVYSDDENVDVQEGDSGAAADNLDIHADMSDDELANSRGRAKEGKPTRGEKRSSTAGKSAAAGTAASANAARSSGSANRRGSAEAGVPSTGDDDDGEPPAKKADTVAETKPRKPRQRRAAWGLKKSNQKQQTNGTAASTVGTASALPLPLITTKVLDKLLPDCRAELKARLKLRRSSSIAGSDSGAVAANGESKTDRLATGHGEENNGDMEEGEVYDTHQQQLELQRRHRREASRSPSQKRQVIRRTKVVDYQVDEPIRVGSARSAENKESQILKVTGLVRPFTLQQLRELLSRFGQLKQSSSKQAEPTAADAEAVDDNDSVEKKKVESATDNPDPIWLDRIKTRCYAEFDSIEEAKKVRIALDNCRWPRHNADPLTVEFASKLELDWARQHGNSEKPVPKRLLLASRLGEDALSDAEAAAADDEIVEIEDSSEDERQARRPASDDGDSAKDGHKNRHQTKRKSPRMKKEDFATNAEKDPEPGTLLDQLFRKTCTTPFIYWMPLNDEQVKVRDEKRQSANASATAKARDSTGDKPRYTRLNLSNSGGGGGGGGGIRRRSRSRSRGVDRDRDRGGRR